MADGWIKLHRKVLENPIACKDSDHLAVWAYILLSATHKEFSTLFCGRQTVLKPGQLITGRKSIANTMKIAESKVQRILKRFESEHQIEQQTSSTSRLITVISWDEYQTGEQPTEQQVNNEWTAGEQRVNTNKNVKNYKNDKKLYPAKPEPELPFKSDAFVFAWNEWVADRKERNKKITHGAMVRQFKFLKTKTEAEAIEIINHAIQNGWQGLYEIRKEKQRKSANPGKIQ